MKTFKTLYDQVVILRSDEEETQGSIIIPDAARPTPQEGTVVSVGDGRMADGTTVSMTVKEGDRVLFAKGAGQEVNFQGEKFIVMKEDDILGIYS